MKVSSELAQDRRAWRVLLGFLNVYIWRILLSTALEAEQHLISGSLMLKPNKFPDQPRHWEQVWIKMPRVCFPLDHKRVDLGAKVQKT